MTMEEIAVGSSAWLYEHLVASSGCSIGDRADCWVLDHILTWNNLLSHIGVHLLEREPRELLLESYRIVQEHGSYVSSVLTVTCLLLRRHCCITRFNFEGISVRILKPILKVLSEGTHVRGLVLGNVVSKTCDTVSLKGSILQLIHKTVEKSPCLDHFEIDLRDTIDECASSLGAVLARKGTLKTLCFSGSCEALVSSYLRTLRKMVVMQVPHKFRVEHLTLSGCNPEQAKDLYVLLSSNETIVSLDLTGHYLRNGVAGWNRRHCLGDRGLSRIAAAMRWNATVQSLKLEDCGLKASGMRALTKMLGANTTLRYLDIAFNKVGDAGCQELAAAIRAAASLKELRVEGIDYSITGVNCILDALKKETSGLVVDFGDISQSPFLDITNATEALMFASERSHFTWTEKCISKLDGLLSPQRQVRKLHFNCEDEDKDCFKALCSQLGNANVEQLTLWLSSWDNKSCQLLADYLSKSSSLRSLWVYSSEMKQCNFEAVGDALKENDTLTELFIQNDGILNNRHDGARCFAEVLSQNRTLQTFELSVPFDKDDLEQFYECMKNNYAVTRLVCRGSTAPAMQNVEQLVTRNCVLQEQAIHFVLQPRAQYKRRWANAFQLTYNTGTLERCLVDMLKKSPQIVKDLLRQKMAYLNANYFQITHVVKERIVCYPSVCRRSQLDNLGLDVLFHIASFLKVSDVRYQ